MPIELSLDQGETTNLFLAEKWNTFLKKELINLYKQARETGVLKFKCQ